MPKRGSHRCFCASVPKLGDDGGADGGRHHEEQQRAAVGGQLLEDDGELGDPHPAPAVLRGDVDPEEAALGQLVPQLVGALVGCGPARRSSSWPYFEAMPSTASRSICCSSVSVKSMCSPRVGRRRRMSARSATGTSTRRERRYSPRLLAWGSGRVDEATPSPSSPCTTKLRASRLGSS